MNGAVHDDYWIINALKTSLHNTDQSPKNPSPQLVDKTIKPKNMKLTLTLSAVIFTGLSLHAAPVQNEVAYLPNADRYIQKYNQQSDEPTLTLKEAVEKLSADYQTASADLKSSLLALPASPESLSNGDASEAFSTARQKIENVLSRSENVSSRLSASASSLENSSSIPEASKQELTQAITNLRESCKSTVLSAQTELQNIRKTDAQITSWKKIYRYYNNLVGKDMASAKLKDSISSFVDGLQSTIIRGNWKITTIDPSANKNQFGKPAVVLFKGNPHVAYYSQDGLSLASWDGSKWNIELVDTSKGPRFDGGGRPMDRISIAFEKSGQPHIAYSQHTKVMYAAKTDKGWNIEELHDEGWVIDKVYVELQDAKPVISYTTNAKNFKSTWSGTEWVTSAQALPPETKIAYETCVEYPKNTEKELCYDTNNQTIYNQPPLLTYKTGEQSEILEFAEPGTGTVTRNKAGHPCIYYVGWYQDLLYPENGLGLKCAELVKE